MCTFSAWIHNTLITIYHHNRNCFKWFHRKEKNGGKKNKRKNWLFDLRFMFSLVIFNNQSLKGFQWSRWTEAWMHIYIKFFRLPNCTPHWALDAANSDGRGKSFGFISIHYCVIFQLELEICGNVRFYGLFVSSEWINDKIGDNNIQ